MEQPNRSTRATADVHRIEISVDWPPGHVAAYIIDGDAPILVDSGMAGAKADEELRAGIETAGRTLDDIEHLVITHPHVDHIGQVSTVIEAAEPTVYAPAGVRARLTQSTADLEQAVRKNAAEAGLTGETLDGAVTKSIESLERNRSLLAPDDVDEWVEDDTQFSVGGLSLRSIYSPGHQADHFCYDANLDGKKVLFSGDILLEPFRSVMIHTGLDDGFADAVPAFSGALDRLDALGPRQIFPGHGPIHDDLPGTVERSRRSIDRMVERTHETVGEGTRTALEIAAKRSGERSFHYVLPEVLSALAHLESKGRVESTVEDGIRQYYAVETV